MASKEKEYVRIGGVGLSRGGAVFSATQTRCSLWLGKDHILQVESESGFKESYKRFYYRDIQSIAVHKARAWPIVNAVLGVILAIFLAGIFADRNGLGVGFFAVFGGIFLIFFLLNLTMGRTCVCHLKTAVSLEELPSINRFRRARKLLARIRPAIEQAQGPLSRDDAVAQLEKRLGSSAVRPGPMASLRAPAERVRAHKIFFGFLLVDAAASLLRLAMPSSALFFWIVILNLALAVAAIVAAINQRDGLLPPGVRRMTLAGFALIVAKLFLGYNMALRFAGGSSLGPDLVGVARLNAVHNPWLLGILLVGGFGSAGLGAFGFSALNRYQAQQERFLALGRPYKNTPDAAPPPLPPAPPPLETAAAPPPIIQSPDAPPAAPPPAAPPPLPPQT